MIDLSGDPFVFQDKSPSVIRTRLESSLPGHVTVTIKDKKPPEIRIRDGLWRGASLKIASADEQLVLSNIVHSIPSFIGKLITFAVSVAFFSIILMIVLYAATGEFIPAIGGVGGLAGVGLYLVFDGILTILIRRSWSAELDPVIEKLRA